MTNPSAELQKMIFDRLVADAGVAALVAGRVYDNVPAGAVHPYISFGPSDVVPLEPTCIRSRSETLQIDIWARDQGRKGPCRDIVDAVIAALDGFEGVLTTHALVELQVVIARVLDDPDGITAHGVVQVTATIEEG